MIDRLTVQSTPSLITDLTHNLTYTDDDNNTVTIASDSVINTRILTRYKFYDYLYTDEDANTNILQDIIYKWREKAIELYKTTLYEYNPVWNVESNETFTTTTTHGHTITREDGLTITTTDERNITNEQIDNASQTYEYGKTDTFEQTTNASLNRNDNGYDSNTAAPSYNETSNAGKTLDTLGGEDTITTDAGKMEEAHSGDITEAHSGEVTDTHSGVDTVVEERERGGNIGTTSSQSLVQQQRDLIIDVIDFYVSQFAEAFSINPFVFLNSYVETE